MVPDNYTVCLFLIYIHGTEAIEKIDENNNYWILICRQQQLKIQKLMIDDEKWQGSCIITNCEVTLFFSFLRYHDTLHKTMREVKQCAKYLLRALLCKIYEIFLIQLNGPQSSKHPRNHFFLNVQSYLCFISWSAGKEIPIMFVEHRAYLQRIGGDFLGQFNTILYIKLSIFLP